VRLSKEERYVDLTLMHSLVRRIRGLIGLGAFSALCWACCGALLGSVVLLVDPASVDAGEGPLWIAYYFARTGFLAGIAAGALIAIAGRQKAVLELRMGAVATIGALAGTTLPWIAFAPRAMLPLLIVLSAGTAAAALGLARRGERQLLDERRVEDLSRVAG
jgi:hypothetical protein